MIQSNRLKSAFILICLLPGLEAFAGEPQQLKTPEEMTNYSIGVEVIRNFKKQGMDINLDLVIKGMKDALSGGKLLLSDKEIRKAMNAFQAELRQKQKQTMRLAAEENKREGDIFLAENEKREGVVTLPGGVQYKVIKAGDGKKPLDTDIVECFYQGTLLDGTEFDSTDTGKPAILKVSNLIPGWRDALKHMPVGSKWQIVVPSQLAYGQRGAGNIIGPNSTLIFEVELLKITESRRSPDQK